MIYSEWYSSVAEQRDIFNPRVAGSSPATIPNPNKLHYGENNRPRTEAGRNGRAHQRHGSRGRSPLPYNKTQFSPQHCIQQSACRTLRRAKVVSERRHPQQAVSNNKNSVDHEWIYQKCKSERDIA